MYISVAYLLSKTTLAQFSFYFLKTIQAQVLIFQTFKTFPAEILISQEFTKLPTLFSIFQIFKTIPVQFSILKTIKNHPSFDFFLRSCAMITNTNFLIPISLQHNAVDFRSNYKLSRSLKYQRCMPIVCTDIRIRKQGM